MHRLILMFALFIPAQSHAATAIFAGGCFWCMEPPFDALEGVISTTSGYTGGDRRHPAYHAFSVNLRSLVSIRDVISRVIVFHGSEQVVTPGLLHAARVF